MTQAALLPTPPRARPGAGLQWAAALPVAIAVGVAALCAPAVWNGFPLLQYDTGGYLARWFEGYLVPSRPGAYGLLLAATLHVDFWAVVVLQAATTLWIVWLLLRTLGLGTPARMAGVMLALCAVTSLPFLVSTLLTDIFAGLSVLSLYLLVFRAADLRRGERAALMLFTGFAAATHSATFGMLALLLCATAAAHLLGRIPAGGLRRAAISGALGVVLTLTGNFAVSGRIAWTPGGYGILFGRMLQDGIVKRYLDAHCPAQALRLCPHRHTIPQDADMFLWGHSVFNDLGRFDGLGVEMRSIVLGSLRAYPATQLASAVSGTATQLVMIAGGEGVNNALAHTYGIMERFTPRALPALRAARQQQGQLDFTALNRVQVPLGLAALACLPVLIGLGLCRRRFADIAMLALVVGLAVLANAFVCGALANPHDRYGARIVWLAPLTVLLLPLTAFRGPSRAHATEALRLTATSAR